MEPLLTTVDVATIVHKSPKTVRNWVRRGILVGSRLGGQQLLFTASDVEAAVARARTGSLSVPAASSPRPATKREARRSVVPDGTPPLSLREELRCRMQPPEARRTAGRKRPARDGAATVQLPIGVHAPRPATDTQKTADQS